MPVPRECCTACGGRREAYRHRGYETGTSGPDGEQFSSHLLRQASSIATSGRMSE